MPGWGASLLSLIFLSLESKHTGSFESLRFGFPVLLKSQFSKCLQCWTTNAVGCDLNIMAHSALSRPWVEEKTPKSWNTHDNPQMALWVTPTPIYFQHSTQYCLRLQQNRTTCKWHIMHQMRGSVPGQNVRFLGETSVYDLSTNISRMYRQI